MHFRWSKIGWNQIILLRLPIKTLRNAPKLYNNVFLEMVLRQLPWRPDVAPCTQTRYPPSLNCLTDSSCVLFAIAIWPIHAHPTKLVTIEHTHTHTRLNLLTLTAVHNVHLHTVCLAVFFSLYNNIVHSKMWIVSEETDTSRNIFLFVSVNIKC